MQEARGRGHALHGLSKRLRAIAVALEEFVPACRLDEAGDVDHHPCAVDQLCQR